MRRVFLAGITALEMAEGKPPYGDIHPMRVCQLVLSSTSSLRAAHIAIKEEQNFSLLTHNSMFFCACAGDIYDPHQAAAVVP